MKNVIYFGLIILVVGLLTVETSSAGEIGSAYHSLSWVDGESDPLQWSWWSWSISPEIPTTNDLIHFSVPTLTHPNACFAEMSLGGSPTLTINRDSKTVELWFKPPAPILCTTLWAPVCGLEGSFGPLESGEWLFVCYANVPTFSITFQVSADERKCKVKAGKNAGQDSLSITGSLDATANEILDSNEISVEIWSDSDEYLVYSQSIGFNPGNVVNGKYSYKEIIPKGAPGAITSLKFDMNKNTFFLQAKNLNLTGLDCPLSVRIEIGDYYGQVQVDEAIVNGKKPIPMQLMSGYADTLRVDKIKVRKGKEPSTDSLLVKGAFALKDQPGSIGDVVVTWGSQTFTIPGGKFYVKGNAELCKKVGIGSGVASAKFDSVKCTFMITIKNADLVSTSGEVDFSISAFDSFNQNIDVDLD